MSTFQLQVSPAGVHTKSAPAGLGLFGSGGTAYGPSYTDRYRKQRVPTPAELIAQYRNAVYTCVKLNANGRAGVAQKLYVQTRRGDPRPKCKIQGVPDKKQLYLRSQSSMSGRIAGDSDIEEVTDHRWLDLVARPNPYYDCNFMLVTITSYLDVVGNAYLYVGKRDRLGIPLELWPLPAHQVWPVRSNPNTDELVEYYAFAGARSMVKLLPEDIVHFRMFNPWEPYVLGMSPLWALIEHVNVNEQFIGHYQALLDNQARPDAILSPEEMIGEFEQKRLENRLNAKFRAAGFGGLMVTESNMNLQPLGWSPVDLGIFEAMGINVDHIRDAYDVPQALMTKDTNLANLQASLGQHARFAIRPRCINQDETINRVVMPWYDDSGRLFVASDDPTPEDADAKLKETQALTTAGVMKRSEGRTRHGLEKDDAVDKFTLPTSQQVLDDQGQPPQKPAPGQGPQGQGNGRPGGVSGQGGDSGGAKDHRAKPEETSRVAPSIQALANPVADCLQLAQAVREGKVSEAFARSLLREVHGFDGPGLHLMTANTKELYQQLDLALEGWPDAGESEENLQALWQKAKGKIDWSKPDWDSKKTRADAERNVDELDKEGYSCKPDELLDDLRSDGKLVPLKDKLWKRITNTESLRVRKFSDIFAQAHRRKRKVRGVLAEFLAGDVRAPILLRLSSGDVHLFSGDTRLCIARLFDVQPRVWLLDLDEGYKKTAQGVRHKELIAAREKLSSVPPVGPGDQIPPPFALAPEELTTLPSPEQFTEEIKAQIDAAAEKEVDLASLQVTPNLKLTRAEVSAALDESAEVGRPVVIQRGDVQVIVSGFGYLTARVLLGESKATVKVIEVSDEQKQTSGGQGAGEASQEGGAQGGAPGASAGSDVA
jgi:HK97 family phage portal protein